MFNRINIKTYLTLLICFCIVSGQYKHDLAKPTMPDLGLSPNVGDKSLLDPSRFAMQHGFSMSLMSMGGTSLNMNTYTNQMTYMISDKTWLQTDFAFVLPNGSPSTLPNQPIQNNLFYKASLGYQPFESIQFNLSIERMPTYQYRPNYILNPFHRSIW